MVSMITCDVLYGGHCMIQKLQKKNIKMQLYNLTIGKGVHAAASTRNLHYIRAFLVGLILRQSPFREGSEIC